MLRGREVYALSGSYQPDADIVLYGYADDCGVELCCDGRYAYVKVHRYDEEKRRGENLFKGCFVFAEEPDWNALLAAAAH